MEGSHCLPTESQTEYQVRQRSYWIKPMLFILMIGPPHSTCHQISAQSPQLSMMRKMSMTFNQNSFLIEDSKDTTHGSQSYEVYCKFLLSHCFPLITITSKTALLRYYNISPSKVCNPVGFRLFTELQPSPQSNLRTFTPCAGWTTWSFNSL